MINKAGNTPLSERIKGFEHTPKAWKEIRKETETLAKDTIKFMESGQKDREEIEVQQKRFKDLQKVMTDNIGDTHVVTPSGAKWNDSAFLTINTVTAKAIGGIFGQIIPSIGAAVRKHPGGLGAAGKKPDQGGPLKIKTPALDFVEKNIEQIRGEEYAIKATKGLNDALRIATDRQNVDVKEEVQPDPGQVVRTYEDGRVLRAYPKPLDKGDYQKILQNDQFLFADTKMNVQNKAK